MAKARDGFLASGAMGDLVAVQGANGTTLRSRPRRGGPRTEAQRRQEVRVMWIAAYWARMTPEGAEAWRGYAKSLVAHLPALKRKPLTAYQAFFALTSKRLQVDPMASVPMLPPTRPFVGDAVVASTSAASEGVTFLGNRPNAPGVLTELLLQPMANGTRLPTPRGYTSQAFVAFEGDSPEVTVPARPGWYACGYRFV